MIARTDVELKELIIKKSELITETGCRIWLGSVDKDGYGKSCFNSKTIPTHRLIWMIEHGSIQTGMVVMHKCDTPSCVNINHLVIGTTQQNTADKIEKGRSKVSFGEDHYYKRNPSLIRKGSSIPQAKLTDLQVLEIMKRIKNGEMQKTIAPDYGISRQAICAIANGRNWSHLQQYI